MNEYVVVRNKLIEDNESNFGMFLNKFSKNSCGAAKRI